MKKIIALLMASALAACGDGKPTIKVTSQSVCEQTTDAMVRLAHECAQGGGKYPEDCIKTLVANFCPDKTGYTVSTTDYQSSAWRPCTEAKTAESKAACSTYDK